MIGRASSIFGASSSGSRSRASSLHPKPKDISRAESHTNERNETHAESEAPARAADIEAEEPRGCHTHFSGTEEAIPGSATAEKLPIKIASFDVEKHTAEQATAKIHKYGNPTSTVPKKYTQSLVVWNGRLRGDSFIKAAIRPVILLMYPAILWSTVVYSLSLGWLVVLSESVAHIYQHHPYNFTPLQMGLVYLSPFIGGILGTVVAGKMSDIIVRFMARRNHGIYEPEFRLVMGLPVAICTAIGLMGFGWSAENEDTWIIPTAFFGVISFGCSLGSTTAITFAVDSYRQFVGEALVCLNFSKNVFHGLVFSLFFNDWLERDGSRTVFIALGGIQLVCLAFTVPLYIFGKRLRMWTVRGNFAGR